MAPFRGSMRKKPIIFKNLRSRVVYLRDPIPKSSCSGRTTGKETEPPHPAITEAFNYHNQNAVSKYELLSSGSVTPVFLPKGFLYHVDFTAKNTEVANAPEEIFFAEVTRPATTKVLSVRLCISLGPINTISGNRLNGCQYCFPYNNVWHPKCGGFTRGADKLYKTLQDIFDIAVVDQEKHLPMLKEVAQAREHKKGREYSSLQVNDASLYATEAVKFINQRDIKNYELVDRGFGTRVILPKCSLVHINFKVKEADPMAPEKLFFAEMTSTSGVFSFKRCVELGPTELKSGDETGDETNGCYYCHKFNEVCHPLVGGFVRGGDSMYISDEEFYFYGETLTGNYQQLA